ncbi:hypothetical protein [Sphingomonas sp. 3-13AW]|uniref:hypothetical protein n=1 Tax=Sphingomonas sp. 3-13AW TaxID=3050450 RepID=UPI003BB5BD91
MNELIRRWKMQQQVHIEQGHNSPSAQSVATTQELEDKIMGCLPKPLADWLRYEAHKDTCPVTIFKEWRRGAPVDRLLASLRGLSRKDTRRTYGQAHPHASFI